MKGIRKVALILSFLLCIIFSADCRVVNALAGSMGNVVYDEETATLNLTGELTKKDADKIHSYKEAKNVVIKDMKYDNCSSLFSDFEALEQVHINGLETYNTSDMFFFNSSLKNINIENWDLSKVTSMSGMFSGCSALKSVQAENFDVSNVTNMYGMFYGCESLESLSVEDWDVSKVTNMCNMFSKCTALKSLPVENWDVSSVINMSNMFSKCMVLKSLSVENFNVSKVTDISYMFAGCCSLESLSVEGWDVSKVTNMRYMFAECSSLVNLPVGKWDVSNVTDMNHIFDGCSSLSNLPIGNWNVSNAEGMLYGCDSLKAILVQDSCKNLIEFLDSNGYIVYGIEDKLGDSRIRHSSVIGAKTEEDALNYVEEEDRPGYEFKGKSIEDKTIYMDYVKTSRDVSLGEVILVMGAVLVVVVAFVVWADRKRSK